MRNLVNVLLISFIFLAGCGKDLPTFENIDLQQWQKDKNACGSYRVSTLPSMDQQKEKLLALNEAQVISLLGRPDKNELYKRNQKFFYYQLKPSADCTAPAITQARLTIRFNAMGLVNEVMVE